jgi:hypothetical protein
MAVPTNQVINALYVISGSVLRELCTVTYNRGDPWVIGSNSRDEHRPNPLGKKFTHNRLSWPKRINEYLVFPMVAKATYCYP